MFRSLESVVLLQGCIAYCCHYLYITSVKHTSTDTVSFINSVHLVPSTPTEISVPSIITWSIDHMLYESSSMSHGL